MYPPPVRAAARLAVLTACVLWAVSFIATKVALESIPALTVVSLRLGLSAACFAIWLLVARRRRVPSWRRYGWQLVGLSLLGTGLHYGSQTLGLQWTTASNASLYAVTGPITIVVFGAVVLGEKITTRKAVGIALAVAGVLLVMGPQTVLRFELPPSVLGDLLVLLSIVLWGLFTVYGKKVTDELGPLTVTSLVTLIGAAWMFPVGLVQAWERGFAPSDATVAAWGAVAFLGVGCSFLAVLLYFFALGQAESQRVGVYLYTIPPMTAVAAAVSLGERLDTPFFIGSALVLIGVRLTETRPGRLTPTGSRA